MTTLPNPTLLSIVDTLQSEGVTHRELEIAGNLQSQVVMHVAELQESGQDVCIHRVLKSLTAILSVAVLEVEPLPAPVIHPRSFPEHDESGWLMAKVIEWLFVAGAGALIGIKLWMRLKS